MYLNSSLMILLRPDPISCDFFLCADSQDTDISNHSVKREPAGAGKKEPVKSTKKPGMYCSIIYFLVNNNSQHQVCNIFLSIFIRQSKDCKRGGT